MKDREHYSVKVPSEATGWEPVDGESFDTFITEQKIDNSVTPDFADFAEASRARWDLVEFLKTKLRQLKNK